jgi:hypothetical protein
VLLRKQRGKQQQGVLQGRPDKKPTILELRNSRDDTR